MLKHHSFSKFILFILFILFNNSLYSQTLSFTHYSVNEGLSSSVVNCTFQDSEGYMWFGTQDGLNLFDGYNFKHFKNNPLDSLSISDNWIYGITEDLNSNLWIATRAGIHKYNKADGTFSLFLKTEKRISYNVITDSDGDIVINSLPIITIINPSKNTCQEKRINFTPDNQLTDLSQPILQDKKGNIWIGNTSGLVKFNKKTTDYKIYQHNRTKPNSLSNNYITALLEDNEGKIWVCTKKGVNVYHEEQDHFIHVNNQSKDFSFESIVIRSIYQDNKNNIWLGTEGNGLKKINAKIIKSNIESIESYSSNVQDPNSISNDDVLTIFQDKSEVLWLGTLAGIDKVDLKEKKFNLYRKSTATNSVNLLDNVIASIYKDLDNKIWIGNWGSGLNIYDRNTNEVIHYSSEFNNNFKISNNYVHLIFNDSKNNIWIGTRNGIDIYNRNEKKFYPIQEYFNSINLPNFKNNRIFCIIEDFNKHIWIGTRDGLYVLDFQNSSYLHYTTDLLNGQKISDNLVYDLLQDKSGCIWIGTNNGLDLYNPNHKSITNLARDESETNTLCNNFIVSLCEDHRGDIWIGTKSGVNQFNKNDSIFYYYSELDGLPSNVVYEILLDDNNNLWFGTGKGLTTYNSTDKTFKTFDLEDGLQSLEFNLNAKYKANDGEIFFGGMNGVNSFHPNSLSVNNNIPSMVITSFEKENENGKQQLNVYGQEEIVLNHDDYSFSIEFASLDYTHPQKNKYKYIVEELMENWSDIGNRRFVSFSNISPGTYTFKVIGANNDGIWNEKGITLIITIKPPWWKTIIAYFGYSIFLLFVIIIYVKYREKKLLFEKKILEQKVNERTTKINKQKEEIQKSYSNVKQLSEIGKKITSLLSIDLIIDTAYDNVSYLMDTDLFTIGFYKKEANTIVFPYIKENGAIIPYKSVPINGTNYPAKHCLMNKTEILINSYDDYLVYTTEPPQIGSEAISAIYIPLIRNNESYGVLTVQSNNGNAYSEYHINILRNIGIYTSIALENADAINEIENQKEEIKSQRDEIETQRDFATEQRDKIAHQNSNITNSILYAKRIQTALLPSMEGLKNIFPDHFVYFKPRDIVSGDFYWVHQKNNKIYLAVADCTGHGVPGAFVSLLGISYLNEIIQKDKSFSASEILEELRSKIKSSLHHSERLNEPKDGMDLAFLIIDLESYELQFSGAYNPVIIVRDEESIKLSGDRMPIGYHIKEGNFTNHRFKLKTNDKLYLYSDGFTDQFGGNDKKKYLRSNFEKLLFSLKEKSMKDQKEFLDETFINWKGENKQIDDILIMGIKM